MRVIKNAIMVNSNVYDENGTIVLGTNRICLENKSQYWQQANDYIKLHLNLDKLKITKHYRRLSYYIGNVPMHFGHLLVEGLPRFAHAHKFLNNNISLIGHIVHGYLPEGIKATSIDNVKWLINAASNNKFINISKDYMKKYDGIIKFDSLIVPDLPYNLSTNCAEPYEMCELIKTIVYKARKCSNYQQTSKIDTLYLKRYEEENINGFSMISDPTEFIYDQIAKVSYASSLYGKIGSNSHISIFADKFCQTNWKTDHPEYDGYRNQLICDLVKSYNEF